MSGARVRTSSQGTRGAGNAASSAASSQQVGIPLVPPRVDVTDAMKRFNPFHFHIDTDTKDTTELRAVFAALQRDAFVASGLFVLDRVELVQWFAGGSVTDPQLAQLVADVKLHSNTLINFDAHNYQQLPPDGAGGKSGGGGGGGSSAASKKDGGAGELSVTDAGALLAAVYKYKILQLAADREMKLIKEEDERLEAFEQAVERFVEEGLSREAAIVEAQKEEDAARGAEEGGNAAAGAGGASPGATVAGGGGASPAGGVAASLAAEEDVPGADGRLPTFVLFRGFPQTAENVSQLAAQGIQMHSAMAVNSLARLGKKLDETAGGLLGADASANSGKKAGGGGGGGAAASGGADGSKGGKKDGAAASSSSSAGGGKQTGGAGGKKGVVPALSNQQQQQPILSLCSAVKKEVMRIHPFLDNPLRHVHCWIYNVATAEGTRVVDEATGQKERILQESENDVADRVVSEVIAVEAALNRYKQWIATRSVAPPDSPEEQLQKEKEREEAAAAKKEEEDKKQKEADHHHHHQPAATEKPPAGGGGTLSSYSSAAGAAAAAAAAASASSSSATLLPAAASSTLPTARSYDINTALPLVHLRVPRLVDVAAEMQCKAAEEERNKILDLHKAHEAAVMVARGGRGGGGGAAGGSGGAGGGAGAGKKLTGKQQRELADATSGLPEVPPPVVGPPPLPSDPSKIPHDSALLRHVLDAAPVSAAAVPEVVLSATVAQAAAIAAQTIDRLRGGNGAGSSDKKLMNNYNSANVNDTSVNNLSSGSVPAITVGGVDTSGASNSESGSGGGAKTQKPHNSGNALESTQTSVALPTRSSAQSVSGDGATTEGGMSGAHHSTSHAGGAGGHSPPPTLQLSAAKLAQLDQQITTDVRDVLDFCDYMFACIDGEEEAALESIRKRRLNATHHLVLDSTEQEQMLEREREEERNKKQQQQSDAIFRLTSDLDLSRGGTVDPETKIYAGPVSTVGSVISKYNDSKYLLQGFLRSLSVPSTDIKSLADMHKATASLLTERCGFSLEDATSTVARRTLARMWSPEEATARLAQATQTPDLSIRIASGLSTSAATGGCIAVVAPGNLAPNAFVPVQERKRFRVTSAFFGGTVTFPEWMARRAYIEKEELFFNPPPNEDDDGAQGGGGGSDESSDDEYDEEMEADEVGDDGQPVVVRKKKIKVKPPPEYVLFERLQTKELRRRAALELVRGSLLAGTGSGGLATSAAAVAALALANKEQQGQQQLASMLLSLNDTQPSQALLAQNHAACSIYGETSLLVTRDPATTVRTNITVGGSRSVDSIVSSSGISVSYHATLPAVMEDHPVFGAVHDPSSSDAHGKDDGKGGAGGSNQQSQQHGGGGTASKNSSGRKQTLTPGSATKPPVEQQQPTTPRQVMFKVGGMQPVAAGHATDSDGDGTPRGGGADTGRSQNNSARGGGAFRNNGMPAHPHGVAPLPSSVRVQASFGGSSTTGDDDAVFTALCAAAPPAKRTMANGLQFSHFLALNKSEDLFTFNTSVSEALSFSSSSSSAAPSLRIDRRARRWVRLPVFSAQTGEMSFVACREVSRTINAATAAVQVQYHNGYSVTMLPDGTVMVAKAGEGGGSKGGANSVGAHGSASNSAAGGASASAAADGAGSPGSAFSSAAAGPAAAEASSNNLIPPLGATTTSTAAATTTTATSDHDDNSATPAASAHPGGDNNSTSTVITTRTGARLLLLRRNNNNSSNGHVTSLASRALSVHITNPDELPLGVEWRDVREDGVVLSKLFDGRTLCEHSDGTQFWTSSSSTASNLVTVECWPAEPADCNNIKSSSFSDPAQFPSRGPLSSPITVNTADRKIAFLCVRAGDCFVELQDSAIFTTWLPTSQHFTVDLRTHLAHFQAAATAAVATTASAKGLRFVFDLIHGGIRGVDSLPDACPDGPSGLADAIALHVTPYGRTRLRKLAEDTHPPIDLDVTRPRQIIEQFAIASETLHPPGVLLPDSREALHNIAGPPPAADEASCRRSISLQTVAPKIALHFAAEESATRLKQQLSVAFNNSSKSSSDKTAAATSSSSSAATASAKLHPVDPVIFYIAPDGRALELLRPQEVPQLANAVLHESDNVFSNVLFLPTATTTTTPGDSSEKPFVVVCSVPKPSVSSTFAAQHATLTRAHLATQEAPGTVTATVTPSALSDAATSSGSVVAGAASVTRCVNGPARSVAAFLQRVHTSASAAATYSSSSFPVSAITQQQQQPRQIAVNARVFVSASHVTPSAAALQQQRREDDLLDAALRALHESAPPLCWLERACSTGNSSKQQQQLLLQNADYLHRGQAGPRASAAVAKTQNRFTDQIARRKEQLSSTLGAEGAQDGAGDEGSSRLHYFDAKTPEGATAKALTQEELCKDGGAWWKELAARERREDRGTRGAGFAHFDAAAAKLVQVGHGGGLSSPRNLEKQQQKQQQSGDSPMKQQPPEQRQARPMPRPPSLSRSVAGPAIAVAASSVRTHTDALPASSSSTSRDKSAGAAGGSGGGGVQSSLVLEPSHLEFSPLQRGLRYHTAVHIINTGSNGARFRCKVALSENQKATPSALSSSSAVSAKAGGGAAAALLPNWLRADVPHVRLGPGMRAAIVLEVSGHQPAGEVAVDVVVAFEGPNRTTATTVSTVRIVTVEQPLQQHGSAVDAHHHHQHAVCWLASTGNTVECVGPSDATFQPGTIRKIKRDKAGGDNHNNNDSD